MRRMYSEQELTKIIGEVFDAKIEAGAFDDSISDAVDAYLVEHPVDITALEGKTIAPAVVNATTSVGAPSGAFTALSGGAITGDSIIENMSGYSAAMGEATGWTFEKVYVGAVKNGNKLTFAFAVNITKTSADADDVETVVGVTVPSGIGSKLYPTLIGIYNFLAIDRVAAFSDLTDSVVFTAYMAKNNDTSIDFRFAFPTFELNTKYFVRYEVTFLLGDDLIGE